jgi:hypothetical protein
MMAPGMPGQMMANPMMSRGPNVFPGLNPNPRFDNFGGFGTPFSPFAGQFGSPFLNPYRGYGLGGGLYGGGGYGLGSLLGQYGSPGYGAYPPTPPAANGGNAPAKKEKAIDERMANRRNVLDDMRNDREKAAQDEQRRSRDNPTMAEIVSAKALNDVLDDFRKLGDALNAAGVPNPALPLDKAALVHINVTRGVGNMALLKHGGELNWPAALAGPDNSDIRDRLTAQATDVVVRMKRGDEVDPDTLLRMNNGVELLRARLQRNAGDLSFQSFAEAKRFLQNLSDSIVALRQPDATDHFTGKYALKTQSVLELVKEMNDNSLRFASAVPGDEPAYVALRDALASGYRAATARLAAR